MLARFGLDTGCEQTFQFAVFWSAQRLLTLPCFNEAICKISSYAPYAKMVI
jgi:hypothetical protein